MVIGESLAAEQATAAKAIAMGVTATVFEQSGTAQVIVDTVTAERAVDPRFAAQAIVAAIADQSDSPLAVPDAGPRTGALGTAWDTGPPPPHRSPEPPHEPGRIVSTGEPDSDTPLRRLRFRVAAGKG